MVWFRRDDVQPMISLVAVCLDCRLRHAVATTPSAWLYHMESWRRKHPGHNIEFHSPRRRVPRRLPRWLERFWSDWNQVPWWLDFAENADIKTTYESSAAYTITLASLASSSTWLAGRESTAIANTTAKDLDYLIAAKITVGTTPTTGTVIEVWAHGSFNDTPTYADVLAGTDAAATLTSAAIKQSGLAPLAFLGVDATTSNRVYPMRPTALSPLFGGIVPKNHGIFVTHNTGVALNATGGNHVLSYTGAYLTSA